MQFFVVATVEHCPCVVVGLAAYVQGQFAFLERRYGYCLLHLTGSGGALGNAADNPDRIQLLFISNLPALEEEIGTRSGDSIVSEIKDWAISQTGESCLEESTTGWWRTQ
jgi:hypothetical protein